MKDSGSQALAWEPHVLQALACREEAEPPKQCGPRQEPGTENAPQRLPVPDGTGLGCNGPLGLPRIASTALLGLWPWPRTREPSRVASGCDIATD